MPAHLAARAYQNIWSVSRSLIRVCHPRLPYDLCYYNMFIIFIIRSYSHHPGSKPI